MAQDQWEQAGRQVQPGQEDIQPGAEVSQAGTEAAPDDQQVSGEGSEGADIEQIVERAVEQALGTRLGSLRQDLQDEVQRTVQSFSDKTAHRLSKRQHERLEMLDETLEGLQDMLGPEYEEVKRRKQLDILLQGASFEEDPEQDPVTPQDEPTPQTPAGEPTGDFAQTYLSRQLGSPEEWSPEDRQAIERELSQARDARAWMDVVDKYAEQRRQRGNRGGQQAPQQQQNRGNPAARVVPMRTGQSPGPSTPEQLQAAYDRAASRGDVEEMRTLGKEIDKMLGK
jgi:hypothetical protein